MDEFVVNQIVEALRAQLLAFQPQYNDSVIEAHVKTLPIPVGTKVQFQFSIQEQVSQ